MKKGKIVILLVLMVFILSGCDIKSNELDDATIYTTIYPISYITEVLYGDNSNIQSIYPVGVNHKEYDLTDKQIENYASGDLFVYIGLGKEKEFAKSLINKNKNMLIIDATYGLSSDNIEELWIAPNNFLMLAKNVKTSLCEYLDNSVKEDAINKNYDELYAKVSWLDADLRAIAKEAKENDNNTLVIGSNVFKYLSGYGFNIVSIPDIVNSSSENALNDLKNKFKNGTYTHIITLKSGEEEILKELKDSYKATIVSFDDLITNDDQANDYITIQNENIALIRDILFK